MKNKMNHPFSRPIKIVAASLRSPTLVFIGAVSCLCQSADCPVIIRQINARFSQPDTVLEIECRIEILPPWHINSDSAELSYLITTGVSLADSNVGIHTGKTYPPADTLVLFGKTLSVFSGTVSFKDYFKLHEKAVFPLEALLQYQACGNDMCLPPKYYLIRILETGAGLQTAIIREKDKKP